MRFNSANFLLGLAALGSVPQTLGRALPNNAVECKNTPSLNDLILRNKLTSTTVYKENLARAAPIRITPAKEVPVVKPAGETTSTGTKTGEDSTTARIGASGKTADTSTSGSTTRIGTVDSSDATLWCRAGGCGGQTETTLLTTTELTARGDKGIALAADPKKGTDYTAQETANYKIKKATTEEFKDENGVEDSIPTLEFDDKYGFQAEDGWQRMEVHSGNPHEAVLTTSVGRATKDGKDYVAIVAHTRFARADSNRFQLTASGDQIKGTDGKFLVADNSGTKAVPVAQLMADAAKVRSKSALYLQSTVY